MKRKICFLCALCLLLSGAEAAGRQEPAKDSPEFSQEASLYSPSKDIHLRVGIVNGEVKYEVTYRDIQVLQPSGLLWKAGENSLGTGVVKMEAGKKRSVASAYPVMGYRSVAKNKYTACSLDLTERTGEKFRIEFRVYNDGVAFRYLADRDGRTRVDDKTEFRLPAGSVCWLQPNPRFYEANYKRYESGHLPDKVVAGPPVTVKCAPGVYIAITEGGLANFGGMGLRVADSGCFQAALEGETYLDGNVATPWRIIMVGGLNDLVNCGIVSDVSAPLAEVFQKGQDWVKPGNCVWSWLAGYGVSLENMKRFTDWAAELDIPYNLVDEGWSYWEDQEKGLDAWQMVADLVEYSRQKGVKIWLWKAYPDRKGIEGIQTAERRRAFFKKCRDLGIAGLKIDFFDQESQAITRYYQETLEDAAEYGLLINYHGSNKPTGLSRTYPNELTREAVKGLEYGSSDAAQDVITPYSRFLAGHADYTPMAFQENWMGNTTEAHQIAMTAVFLSPLRCYGGRPEDYVNHPAREIFLSIPTVWDETIVLPPSEVGECVVMAHRSGKEWFIAGLTDKGMPEITVPLAFLARGQYEVAEVADGEGKKCTVSHHSYSRKDQLTICMKAGGGFLARLRPVK